MCTRLGLVSTNEKGGSKAVDQSEITRTCAQGFDEPRDPTGAAAPLVPQGCTSLDAPGENVFHLDQL